MFLCLFLRMFPFLDAFKKTAFPTIIYESVVSPWNQPFGIMECFHRLSNQNVFPDRGSLPSKHGFKSSITLRWSTLDDVFDREAFLGGNENQESTPMKTKKSLSKNDVWKTNHVPFGIVPFKGHVNFRR